MPITNNKVLVVDDYHTHRQLIADFFEDAGYDVTALAATEEIGDELRECGIILMDIQLAKDKPYAGIDYIVGQIQSGAINPAEKRIIFKTMWNEEMLSNHREIIEGYEFWDCREGLAFTELRSILKRGVTS
ncbi:MAG TPA: hypothetical protein VFS76_11000 [Pyrinomonadaceae bacterium]|nr:hypothetical protein [Pyrinomonadaceae bacterium]